MKMNKMKDKAKEFIIDEACKMFLKDSIAGVTMSDIAKEVGVGDATMYRYFGSKQKIIMGVAVKLAKEVYEKYSKNDEEKTGFERIKDFYYTYLDVFKTNNSYFSFIREFDAFFLTEAKEKVDYEYEIDLFKNKYIEAYVWGVQDGTVKRIDNVELFYYSTTHALLNLCKTLSYSGVLVSQDEKTSKEDEIKALIDIILYRLSNK
jgi:AcrR family transcriptional regulator